MMPIQDGARFEIGIINDSETTLNLFSRKINAINIMLNTNHTFTNELNKRTAASFVDYQLSAEAKDCAGRCEILKVEFCVKTGTICL